MTKDQYFDAKRILENIEFLEELVEYLRRVDIKREASTDNLRVFIDKLVKAGFASPLRAFILDLKHKAELRIEELEAEFAKLGNE